MPYTPITLVNDDTCVADMLFTEIHLRAVFTVSSEIYIKKTGTTALRWSDFAEVPVALTQKVSPRNAVLTYSFPDAPAVT